MHQLLAQLVIYRNLDPEGLLPTLGGIFKRMDAGAPASDELIAEIYAQIAQLLDLATRYGFNGDLWQCYLAWLLATTENPFSLACEKIGIREGSVNILAIRDFTVFKALYDYDFAPVEKALGIDCFSIIRNYQALDKPRRTYNHHVSRKVLALREALLQATDGKSFFRVVTDFYRIHGIGMFGLNQVFRLAASDGQADGHADGQAEGRGRVALEPITNTVEVRLNDLIGYESQKQRLIENTEAFLHGIRANNLLLYGDSGTGKSTCIKALINEYHEQGLRIIEIYKHQFKDLSAVISQIKNRNYRFIIFMDDLSFEDFEIEYKYLKAVIEGGMEVTPENMLIYATSNRRHLVKETWTDRKDAMNRDDIHHSDTMEEKISLVNRFGVTILFSKPGQEEYLDIVKGIAKRHPEITLDEETLTKEAIKWGLWNGNISGRRAQQFVNHLLGQTAFSARPDEVSEKGGRHGNPMGEHE